MSSERRTLAVYEDLNTALGVVLRWIKRMETEDLIATVKRIDAGVKRLNGSVADHDEQLQSQAVTNATTAMLISAIQDEQRRISKQLDDLKSQIGWVARIVIGAVIAQVLVQVFV